jgi:acetyl esterase/lipase
MKELRAPIVKALYERKDMVLEDNVVPGPRGDIPVTVMRPSAASETSGSRRPGVVFIHGGGFIVGDRFWGIDDQWIVSLGAVVVAVDYRLAPEFSGLALVEDCYAALTWVAANLQPLGIDPARLALAGASAGGALAAGTALMSRDRGGPRLCALSLKCPMLDDRNNSLSCHQYADDGSFSAAQNRFSWACVLGDTAGGDDVSQYIAPARSTDLSNLPETFIDVGSAEPFRDEAVDFAMTLWAAGSQAELHVWPGGFHGFEAFVPDADISKGAIESSFAWMRKKLIGPSEAMPHI